MSLLGEMPRDQPHELRIDADPTLPAAEVVPLVRWEPGTRRCLPGGRVTATAACSLALQVFCTYDRVFGGR